MPPRIPHQSLRALRPTSTCPSSSLAPHPLYFRDFSHSCPQLSLRRDQMFAWLEGPGKAYKRPKPAATNYLVPEAGAKRGGPIESAEKDPNGLVAPADQADELIDKMDSVPAGPEEDAASASQVGAVPLSEEEQYFDAMKRLKKARDSSTAGRSNLVEQENLNPFPLNPWFRSQPVLSEELKEDIYKKAKQGKTVREVSEDYQVSMERVGAVVRMKQMEHDWLEQGKPLAVHYSRAVMDMLPQTPYSPTPIPHEPINDLPVHPWTTQQIFWPTSESREFTRVDAGEVFGPNLLPADMRIPHPEMIEKQSAEIHKTRAARLKLERSLAEKAMQRKREETERTKVIEGGRFNFKFKDVSVQWVGKDGRSRRGVGWRYGMPHEDRKPGQIKIPTSV